MTSRVRIAGRLTRLDHAALMAALVCPACLNTRPHCACDTYCDECACTTNHTGEQHRAAAAELPEER